MAYLLDEPVSAGKNNAVVATDLLGDDIWRMIVLKLDVQSLSKLRRVSASFGRLVREFMVDTWEKWNTWKNQVPLYPPEVSGYSTAAKSVDKLLFERLVCMVGPQTLSLGSFEREGRRFVHWRTAAMAQSVPELVSSCKKGDFQYKATFLELPKHFNFNVLISSQPPEAQAVLEAVSLICHDCGQRKDSNASNPGSNQNFCNDCFEEKAQATPPWVTILPRH